MRLAVAGGRDYRLTERDYIVLADIHRREKIDILLHGGCRGADLDAAQWALDHGIATETFTAAWDLYGKAAGPLRGEQMVDNADMLVAFPGGRGTRHAIAYAKKQGKRLLVIGGNDA
jgi:hypothetical protein